MPQPTGCCSISQSRAKTWSTTRRRCRPLPVKRVTVRFRNISQAQQHNWVLVENGTKDDVTADGVAAGADNHWVAPDDPRVFIQTGLLEPETTGRVPFVVPPAGTYQFVCTFPAHNITMFGTFTSTP